MTASQSQTITKEVLTQLRGSTESERLLHRLHSVALVMQGIPPKQVAAFYGDAPRTVTYWVTRFKREGVSGLIDKPRSGQPLRLSPSQMEHLRTFVKKKTTRDEKVSAPALSKYIKTKWSITLGPRQCQRILQQLV